MKRRQVITAFGTLAIGTGTALGTGAFSATSSSSNAAMSVVTQGADANLDIAPGAGVGSGNIEQGLRDTSNLDIGLEDLPVAAVEDNGQGMVNIQVFTAVGGTADFNEIIEVLNYDDIDYEVGFIFSGINTNIDISDINSIYQFIGGSDTNGGEISDVISGGSNYSAANGFRDLNEPVLADHDPDDLPASYTVESRSLGDDAHQVSLHYDGSTLVNNYDYDTIPGDFDGTTSTGPENEYADGASTTQLVNEVTAVASPSE